MSEENTGAVEAAPTEAVLSEAVSTEAGSQVEAHAYTPNYNFKVHDKEHTFDPEFQSYIKDADSEKKMRDLYERAFGLDQIKPKYEKTKQDYQQLNQNWGTVTQDLQKVGLFLNNKDYGSFFKSFNLTDQDVMQYALERLQFHELPPEKQAQIQGQQQRNEEYVKLQQENSRYRDYYQSQEVNQLQNSLNQEIGRPEISSMASQYDARAGKAGAFREAVIHHANVVYSASGKDMGAQEAVNSFTNLMGFSPSQQAGQQTQGTMPVQPNSANRPATLPKIQSGGGSHVKSQVRSIDDLKKIRAQITD